MFASNDGKKAETERRGREGRQSEIEMCVRKLHPIRPQQAWAFGFMLLLLRIRLFHM